jgi:hypothetical protein
MIRSDEVEKRIRVEGHQYRPCEDYESWLKHLLDDAVISKEEMGLMKQAYRAAHEVIMVDDFPPARKQAG